MHPRRLFSRRRLARCRELFVHPWRAHLKLAYLPPKVPPFSVTFRGGAELRHDRPQSMRELWDLLLEDDRAGDVTCDGGLLRFEWQSARLAVRPMTLDVLIFLEVFIRDEYRLDGARDLGTVVDLGGQAGLFAARAAAIAERVVSVEASPDNLVVYRANNDAHSGVTLVHAAVARESDRTVKLYTHPGNTGGHSLDAKFIGQHAERMGLKEHEPECVEVPTISLPDLFEQQGIEECDLLKCDIEGAEYEVFEGADDETLRRVRRIAMEMHEHAGADDSRMDAVKSRLSSLGFRLETTPSRERRDVEPWAVTLHATRVAE